MTSTSTIATPTLTADIVLFRPALTRNDTQVLLIKRGRGPCSGYWALPGGKLHTGESLEECALRELHEETGIVGVELEQVRAFSALPSYLFSSDYNSHVVSL
jgi:8-oxo-dGTP diphosphatase